jgi:hypothetical protein
MCKRCERSGHDLIEDIVLTSVWNGSIISQKICKDSQSLDLDLKLGPLNMKQKCYPHIFDIWYFSGLFCLPLHRMLWLSILNNNGSTKRKALAGKWLQILHIPPCKLCQELAC